MRAIASHILARGALIALVAIGLVTAGFAHRAAPPVDDQLLAFFEAGGSVEDLCLDASHRPHELAADCEACRLVSGADLPGGTWTLQSLIAYRTADFGGFRSGIAGTAGFGVAEARAPPPLV